MSEKKRHNGIFSTDLRITAGITRIFFGVLGFWITAKLDIDFDVYLSESDFTKYDPIGILQFLFPSSPPSAIFMELMAVLGYVFSCLLIVGLFSRFSLFVVIMTGLSFACLKYSWGTSWSHGYNVVYLAMIPALFMPLSQYMSLDKRYFSRFVNGWYRRFGNNGWAIFLSLSSVCMMYFNAFFYKIYTGEGLAWATTDSIRNYIIERYLIFYHTEIPFHLKWVVDHEWAWNGLAFGNLLVQGGAILAIIFFKNRTIKFIIGGLFVLETLGLGLVMNLWNWPWILLFVLYIDWETLIEKRFPKYSVSQLSPYVQPSKKLRALWIAITVSVLAFQIVVSFDPNMTLEHKLKPYPYSSFPMFKSINCKKPYDKHLPMFFRGNHFDYDTELLSKVQEDSLRSTGIHITRYYYRRDIYDTTLVKMLIRKQQEQVMKRIHKKVPVQWSRDLLFCPAYPEPVELKTLHRGLIAMVDTLGKVKMVKLLPKGKNVDEFYLEMRTTGYDSLRVKDIWAYHVHTHDGPMEVEYEINDDRILVTNLVEKPVQLAIEIEDLASHEKHVYFTGKFKLRSNGSIWRDKVSD